MDSNYSLVNCFSLRVSSDASMRVNRAEEGPGEVLKDVIFHLRNIIQVRQLISSLNNLQRPAL